MNNAEAQIVSTTLNPQFNEPLRLEDLVVSGIDGNGNEHIIYYVNKDDPNYLSYSVSNDHKHQCCWIFKHYRARNKSLRGEILLEKDEVMYPQEFVKWLNERLAQ